VVEVGSGISSDVTHLQGLNPQQQEAVAHFQGPLLVLAGAGSGKTRVLTARICHLVRHHGVSPHRILAVTFTNKAAGEMRDRVRNLLGEEPRGMWLGTFHSLGARILRRHAPRLGWSSTFTIYDQDQSLRQIKRAQEEVGIDPKRWSPKAFRAHVSGAKNQLIPAETFVEENGDSFDLMARNVAKVFPVYQEALRNHDAFDFDDLLMKPVELLEGHPEVLGEYRSRFSFLLVDEYQDTNRAQFRFLELLARESENLMVVGDDDQSIYAWRGADIQNILDFEASFPGAQVVRLEQNYRSSRNILDAANQVILHNVQRKGKKRPMRPDGSSRRSPRAGPRSPTGRTGPSRSSTGSMPRPGPWRMPFEERGFRTRWWGECDSMNGGRSRMFWPTSGSSRIHEMAEPSTGS
jgi:DNA helicase-2/ATP-dependent DNA helicase PcrA